MTGSKWKLKLVCQGFLLVSNNHAYLYLKEILLQKILV